MPVERPGTGDDVRRSGWGITSFLLLVAASAWPQTPVNMYIPLANATVGVQLTPSVMEASGNVLPSGTTWTNPSGYKTTAMKVAASAHSLPGAISIGGATYGPYSPSHAIAYNDDIITDTLHYIFSGSISAASMGMWITVGPAGGTANDWQLYDWFIFWDHSGVNYACLETFIGGPTGSGGNLEFSIETKTTGDVTTHTSPIDVVQGSTYWVTMKADWPAQTAYLNVYDTSFNLVGSVTGAMTNNTGNTLAAIDIGNQEAGQQSGNTTYFENIIIDTTNAAFPLLPSTVVPTGPVITSASTASFTVLAPESFTVTSTGYPTPALTESGALPSGVTFTDNGNGTGSFAGTPASGTAGTYPITFTASNSAGSTTQSFTLTVDLGVAITSGASTTFTVGSAGSFTVTTVGTPTPALSETGSLPSGVTFVDNGDGMGTLSATPASGTPGNYPITFAASNSVSSATQNFTLTVNQGPAITSGSATTFAVGTAGSFPVTATGAPTPALSETGSLPSGVTFVDNSNGTATLSGTPAAGSGGSYLLSITAANGLGTNATQSFTLTINQGLAITSGSMTTFTVGSTGFFSVITTGSPVPALTETGSLPNGVTFTDNGNGTATLSGTPAAETGGTYPLTITAGNGGVDPNAMQSFTLVVNQDAAILTGNSTTFTVGVAGSFTVSTTGVPVPALSKTGALPGGVTFVDNGNGTGTLSGTPVAGSGGTYAITFTANNGVGTAAVQSFTLMVNQGPAISSTNTATFTAQVACSFTVTTTGDPTPALSETGSLPSGVTFVDNGNGTATLSGTSAAGTAGQYGFTIQASNGVSPNATQTFTLTVQQAPAITSAPTTTFTVGLAGTFTVTATGSPAPTLSEAGTLPSGVTFNASTGVLSGIPGTTTAGTYSISFTAANGFGSNFVQSFSLIVSLPSVSSVSLKPTSVPGGITNSTGTVTLNAPAAGTAAQRTVTLSSSNTSAATVPASVTVAAGATSATFTVTSHNVSVTETANISAMLNGRTQTAALTVTPPPGVVSLTLSPTSVVGGTAHSTATLTLNAPAAGTAAERRVPLSSSNTSAATVPASVTVAAGATTATFTVTSEVVSTAASSVITATLNGSATATLTVDPLLVVSLVPSPTSVVGGTANSTATLTLNAPAAGTAAQRRVTLSSSNTSAATVPASVTVAAGATTATFTVTSHAVAASTTSNISATLNGGTQTATLTVIP